MHLAVALLGMVQTVINPRPTIDYASEAIPIPVESRSMVLSIGTLDTLVGTASRNQHSHFFGVQPVKREDEEDAIMLRLCYGVRVVDIHEPDKPEPILRVCTSYDSIIPGQIREYTEPDRSEIIITTPFPEGELTRAIKREGVIDIKTRVLTCEEVSRITDARYAAPVEACIVDIDDILTTLYPARKQSVVASIS